MNDGVQRLSAADLTAAMQRTEAAARITEPLPPAEMDVAPEIEVGLSTQGECIDAVARVVWAARDLIASWDAARILGVATQDGRHVPALLRRVEALRAALAGRPL